MRFLLNGIGEADCMALEVEDCVVTAQKDVSCKNVRISNVEVRAAITHQWSRVNPKEG